MWKYASCSMGASKKPLESQVICSDLNVYFFSVLVWGVWDVVYSS